MDIKSNNSQRIHWVENVVGLKYIELISNMTEHQGLPVEGYKPQAQSNVDLVSANKRLEEQVLRVIDELQSNPNIDGRWAAIAKTMIEQGFMALNRAVFKPTRISLEEKKDA